MTPPIRVDAAALQPSVACGCRHCGLPTEGRGDFCCRGCENVFLILNARGLGEYYELKEGAYCFQPPQAVTWKHERFDHLDGAEVRPRYVSGTGEARFFVEGLHCVACLWLLERLPRMMPGLKACRLDVSQSLLTVTLEEGTPLAPVAGLIQDLGYRPHAIPSDQDAEDLQRADRRRSLLRMGVAAACTGNIMLMAVPLYGGATGTFGQLFRWLSLGLYLPVAFWAALPFYRTALGALRSRRMNIDVPIALALVVGALVSTFNLLAGSPHIYFDSLAALVFLLLASRYYLKQVQLRAARSSQLLQSFFAPIAHRLTGGAVQDVPPDHLQPGDRVRVESGERLPADGVVVVGATQLNAAWLTGEHLPVEVKVGDAVHAGTVNEGAAFELEVGKVLGDSRLGQILHQLEREARSPIIGLTDQVSRHFLTVVLVLAVGVFLAFAATHPAEGLNRALSLLIVTCPCALALATPLTFSYALARAYRKGYVVKSGEALERLSQVRSVFFDKTGTLTHGELVVDAMVHLAGDPARNRRLLRSLEQGSLHPIARAIRHHLEGEALLPVTGLEEQVGVGLQGRIEGRTVEVKAVAEASSVHTCIGLFEEGRLLARVELRDRLRAEAPEAVKALREAGCEVNILSGDARPVVEALAREVGLPSDRVLARLSPEAKHAQVEATPFALMVGDGANDALALRKAHVGMAMHGGMDLSLKVADVYLSHPDLGAVADLLVLGRETRRVLWRNFGLSLAYNLVGGLAALGGWINPLAAAVIMPLSSITVLLSSTLSTREVRRRFREAA
ncbi:MAG TPA: heavy metal translocating P-type ATPase metal-binding domain-containing protein [Holophagaceae bacterium]|nr:heavy metal translocating P-type ATPase metal-binding domain-containing protein [Holophagaceae bacterium]